MRFANHYGMLGVSRTKRTEENRTMKRLDRALVLVFAGCLCASAGQARPRVDVEFLTGVPLNLRTSFELAQEGFDELNFVGSYKTEPFRSPIYYAVRVGMASESCSWSIELLHHKVFLQDGPDEIESFSVTHGFNLLTVQRAWIVSPYRIHAGLGAVVAHPESRVRGRKFDETRGALGSGYYFAGPALTSGVGRRFPVGGRRYFFSLDGRATLAPVKVPVAAGEAEFTNIAFHAMFGFGGSF